MSDWTTTATTLPGRWTKPSAVLDPEELEFASSYWDIGELGDMHHNPAKNVLHVNVTLEERAAQGGNLARVARAARQRRGRSCWRRGACAPRRLSTRTLYTGWNAMAVTAYLETARVLRMESAREFALRTLDRLLERGLGRSRCAEPRDRLPRRGWRRDSGREGSGHARRLRLYRARLHRCVVCKRQHEFLPRGR